MGRPGRAESGRGPAGARQAGGAGPGRAESRSVGSDAPGEGGPVESRWCPPAARGGPGRARGQGQGLPNLPPKQIISAQCRISAEKSKREESKLDS